MGRGCPDFKPKKTMLFSAITLANLYKSVYIRNAAEGNDSDQEVEFISSASPAGPASEEKPSSVWVECAGDPEFLATCFEQEPLTRDDEQDVAVLQLSDTDSDEQEDSPRFTLQELRDVLYEKNQLKAQVFLLQEELAFYSTEDPEDSLCVYSSSPPEGAEEAAAAAEPESGIRRLIFTAIMPMVAAGLISDDPTLMPIRRLVSIT